MTGEERVEPERWGQRAQEVFDEGCTFLHLLAGVDRIEAREIVLRVVDPVSGEAHTLIARVPAANPRIASLADLWCGAAWLEREIREQFGVLFEGHPDPRPLLLREHTGEPPLLKSTPLAERLAASWPGAAEAQERKRRRPQLPPGVRQEWLDAAEGGRA